MYGCMLARTLDTGLRNVPDPHWPARRHHSCHDRCAEEEHALKYFTFALKPSAVKALKPSADEVPALEPRCIYVVYTIYRTQISSRAKQRVCISFATYY